MHVPVERDLTAQIDSFDSTLGGLMLNCVETELHKVSSYTCKVHTTIYLTTVSRTTHVHTYAHIQCSCAIIDTSKLRVILFYFVCLSLNHPFLPATTDRDLLSRTYIRVRTRARPFKVAKKIVRLPPI